MLAGRLRPSTDLLSSFVVLGTCLAAAAGSTSAADEAGAASLVAGATVPWHASLPAARHASLVSRRPVIVIFTAGNTASGAALVRDVFPAPETVALLTAGFEPVCIDVDVDPTTARTYGIGSVPTACILDSQDRLLARLDCPTVPAAFVAAVHRASQEAAAAQASGAVVPVATTPGQSDFVTRANATAPPAVGASPAHTPFDAAAPEEPTLPATPPAMAAAPSVWPAEAASRSMPMASAPVVGAGRPSLDPAPASAPAAATPPWLDSRPILPQPPAAVATAQPAPATNQITAAPPTAAATPAAEPATPDKSSASESFFAALTKPFTFFSKPKQADTKPAGVAAAEPPPGSIAGSIAADAIAPMPLGLEGYCPVSLIDKGTWVEGRAQWGARHRGRTYLFAGQEQQRAFLADPDRYAPALSGDDPVLACDSGRQVAGQRRYGVSYQSRTYLFSSPETRAAFAADPQRYTTRVTIAERPMARDTVVR